MPHMTRRSLFAMVAGLFAPKAKATVPSHGVVRLATGRTHTFGKLTKRGWEFYQTQVVPVVLESNFEAVEGAFRKVRQEALEDHRFLEGTQWP